MKYKRFHVREENEFSRFSHIQDGNVTGDELAQSDADDLLDDEDQDEVIVGKKKLEEISGETDDQSGPSANDDPEEAP